MLPDAAGRAAVISLSHPATDRLVFKKALKIAATFVVLLTAHVVYVRVFAIIAEYTARGQQMVVQLQPTDSRTKKEAIALAAKGFGEGHWAADAELPGRYYNKERGYWMYYKEYERRNEGKQFLFKPFALIWQSRDKKELKTVTADEAVMDLDRPLGLAPNKPGTPPLRIVHAQITGNARIRDDRGTPDTGDDMVIGPMPYVEYDEPTLQVRSESDVVIQDRDMWVNGYDLLIQLRAKEEVDPTVTTGGFEGAKSAFLKSNVHVILYDSGRSGILPAKPAGPQQSSGGERTPVDLRCAGPMQIDLPKPRLPVRVGPPAPPEPTFARFSINVVVLQGKPTQVPDQLNCDHLKLTLLPGKKAPAPLVAPEGGTDGTPVSAGDLTEPSSAAVGGGGGGALGGLTLRRADATGHAVWLQSVSNGLKTRSNELIYKKLAPEKPDETYLRGDTATKLVVEKVDIAKDGPNKGKVESITNIRTIEATIFDDGQSHDPETIIARGAGILEVRPAKDQPVARRAIWRDQLVTQNEITADKQLRKRITLTGDPKFFDLAQATTLDAKTEIIVWLKPKPELPAAEVATTVATTGTASSSDKGPAQVQTQAGPGKFEIEVLRATDDVHLLAPARTLTARDVLVAVFETRPTPVRAGAAPLAPAGSATPATSPTAMGNAASGPMAAAGVSSAPAGPQVSAKPQAKPADPEVRVRANHVWARIALRPKEGSPGAASAGGEADPRDPNAAGDARSEVREARLRGAVFFHEDPAPGKQRGTNVAGEAIDVTNLGDNKMYFKVYNVDPDKAAPLDQRTRISPSELMARIEVLSKSFPLARVETDDFTVEGPKIGLNQLTDEAWVDGRGTLTQLAPRGLLSDKGLDTAPARPAASATGTQPSLTPLKISWTRMMQFKGQSTNPKGIPVARAQFFANVHAEMEDSLLLCQEMTTYMDRTVKLNRPRRAAPGSAIAQGNAPAEQEPKPQIALIDCKYKVLIDNRKRDTETRILVQRQVIDGEHVIYDKLTGVFFAQPEAGRMGKVYLYSREGQDPVPGTPPAPGRSATADRRVLRPTTGPASGSVPVQRATEVVGRNGTSPIGSGLPGSGSASTRVRSQAEVGPAPKPTLGPLKVTQVVYADEMHGRFGSGKERDTTETRWADFFGDVEVLHALAPNEFAIFDLDNPPVDATILTAQTIRVVSEPSPPGSKAGERNFLRAWENANAETIDTTIQADRITYDSSKELFYAYGELDQVYLVQQKFVGQPPVTASGDAVWYNRKTGESQVIDPKTVQFVDDKFGARPTRQPVKEDPKKPKKPVVPFRGPGRAHFERKGFNGH
jgi:hypothetical protein